MKSGFTQHHFQSGNLGLNFKKPESGAGFTLIELILVFAILSIVAIFSIPFIQSFQVTSDLYTHADSIAKTLRRAQQQAITGQESSSWGVYFDEANKEFILFKGDDYASREQERDQETNYGQAFTVSTDFGNEIYFALYSGNPSTVGTTTISAVNVNESEDIVIEASGLIQINE